MSRSRTRRLSVIGAIVVAVLGVSTTALARAGHGGPRIQRFVLVQTDPNAAGPLLVAGGPIHARGTDTVIDDNRDVFVFPKGSIKVVHVAKHNRQSFDPTNCYGHVTERGTYRVTGGTGAYANASGHGTYQVEVNSIGCSENAPPDVLSVVIKAHGPIHFGSRS